MIVKHVYTARTRPCTQAVNTAVYTCTQPCTRSVHGHGLCTRVNDRVTCYTTVYTAVYATVYATVHTARTRPCGVHTALYTCRIHGRIRAVYMVVFTAMYGTCTRWPCIPPCTRPVHSHGLCTRPCTRSCTRPSLRPICTAEHTGRKDAYTSRVHGRIHGRVHMHATDTRVLDRVHRLYRPPTRFVHGRV